MNCKIQINEICHDCGECDQPEPADRKTCKIYFEKDSWKLLWYPNVMEEQIILGHSQEQLIETAKKMNFTHYFSKWGEVTIPL